MPASPATTFETRLGETAAALEPLLAALLDGRADADAVPPQRLLAAMRHALLGGGKRFRPFLLVECARLAGLAPALALPAAAAVECLHSYSLVHDDLPAMDDDALRRGRPTVHVAFDEATAILAGDALQSLAFEVLARPATHADPAVRAQLVALLAHATGAAGMAGGQMLDLAAEGAAPGRAAILRLQAMKTGALIAAACEMGAVLAGAGEPVRAPLRGYGAALGLAFQIADDLLDIEATPQALGKATAKDAGRGKATFVGLLGAAGARALLDETLAGCAAHLRRLDGDVSVLLAAARFAAERGR